MGWPSKKYWMVCTFCAIFGSATTVYSAPTPESTIMKKMSDYNKPNLEKFGFLMRLSDAGNADAMAVLGLMYLNGIDFLSVRDVNKAKKLLMQAHKSGNQSATKVLGMMYIVGDSFGVEKDVKKANEMLLKFADTGDEEAIEIILWMGEAYLNGSYGIGQDFTEAFKWFKKLADLGRIEGTGQVSKMYALGQGVEKNPEQAVFWRNKTFSAAKNIEGADEGVRQLTAASESGDTHSTYYLGIMYLNGIVVNQDVKKGLDLLSKSAQAGYGLSAWMLGSVYENGSVENIKQDSNRSAYWYIRALNAKDLNHIDITSTSDGKTRTIQDTTRLRLDNLLAENKITDSAILLEVRAIFKPSPRLTWATLPTSSFNQETLQLAVNIKDSGSGIGNIRLLVNGVAVDQQGRGLGRKDSKPTEQRTFSLKLPQGTHKITIEAYNAENLGEVAKLETTITSTYQKPYKPRLHAVVIGIDQYKNSQLKLNYAVSDANAIYASLNKQIGGLYDAGSITLLTTPAQTSKQAIQEAINQVKQNAQLADVFVLYVAGHGVSYPDDGYYMLTSDVLQPSQDRIKATSIPAEELQSLIAQVPTQKKLVLLDTCNSGGAFSADKLIASRGMGDQGMIDRMKRKSGATILMASESTEQAREGYKGHGLFTYTVLQAFAGQSDYDKDGYVDSDEIKKYVENTVPVLAEQQFKTVQTPFASVSGQGLSFKVN
ncbi:MAG: SEL1-like repeat protein [Pseudomonadales bacterium]|nr:SEL1-like repeat protein [Pseudomonadales bacterium]